MDDLRKYVKPLEWEGARWGNYYTICGLYKAKVDDGGGAYSLTWSGKVIRDSDGRTVWFETIQAAKAAAQADYERRILEAADLNTAFLDGVKAGLEAAEEAARGDGESEFFNPVQAIRALDPAAIAREAQKENPNG